MDDTVDAIVSASTLPLSIVIVGVGMADFSAMERLDADTVPLVDRRGAKMSRDIVQFGVYLARRHGGVGIFGNKGGIYNLASKLSSVHTLQCPCVTLLMRIQAK